jgi:hypothetical protein
MLPLETLQRMMTASILSATSSRLGSELEAGKASPLGRLEIYRNNTLISLTEALKANFPVTVRLVDERFFRWVAQDFIRHHPPREPRLALYGAALPAFLAAVPACRTVPYLAEVARLEWAICQSLQAEQLNPCSPERLSGLGGEAGAARLILQPALQLVPARWPVMEIWMAHQSDPVEISDSIVRQASHVQVMRHDDRVRLTPLQAGRFAFRRRLARGLCLQAALEWAVSRDPAFSPAHELASLFAENIVTKIIPAQGDRS